MPSEQSDAIHQPSARSVRVTTSLAIIYGLVGMLAAWTWVFWPVDAVALVLAGVVLGGAPLVALIRILEVRA